MTDMPKMRCPVCENPTPITEAGKIDRHCTEIENRAVAKAVEDFATALSDPTRDIGEYYNATKLCLGKKKIQAAIWGLLKGGDGK